MLEEGQWSLETKEKTVSRTCMGGHVIKMNYTKGQGDAERQHITTNGNQNIPN